MDRYEILKYVHILFAIVALGFNLSYAVWLRIAAKEPEKMPFTIRGIQKLDNAFATPGYIGLLITGILLVLDGPWEFGDLWVTIGITLYVLVAVLGMAAFAPAVKKLMAALESEGPASPAFAAANRTTTIMGAVTIFIVLVIEFVMVTKPT